MSGSQAVTINRQDIQSILHQHRIRPNKLANFLGLDEKITENVQSPGHSGLSQEEHRDEKWGKLITQLMQPHNLSFITAVNPYDDVFFTSLVAGEADYLYYGGKEEGITLKTAHPQEAATLLGDYIGVADILKTGTSLTMSRDGLLALACLVDRFNRQKLENLVLHVVMDEPVTPQSLEEELAIAMETRDLRWAVPFVLETFVGEATPDIAKGLGELASIGITTKAKKQVILTARGQALAGTLVGPRGMLAVKALYYHQGSLVLDSLMFLRVSGYLYAIQDGNSITWTSIDQSQFQEMIATILAPGEAPELPEEVMATPVAIKEEVAREAKDPVIRVDTGEKKKPRPKFCRFCGTPLKARGKFCHSCGKEIGS